jgi:mono/diheme cytochrome c family protein
MRFSTLIWLRVPLIFVCCLPQAWSSEPRESSIAVLAEVAENIQSTLTAHCTACHAGDDAEADLDLEQFSSAQRLLAEPQWLHKISQAIDTGFMPPAPEQPLAQADREQLVSQLRELLSLSLASRKYSARTPLRRMNRFQFNNAIVDLFQLDVQVYPLRERMMRDLQGYFQPHTGRMPERVVVASRPLSKFQFIEHHLSGVHPFAQDLRAEHGFDNRGDHLSLSPVLMESILQICRSIVESPDFNAEHCGVWSGLFESPKNIEPSGYTDVIRQRFQAFLQRAFRSPVEFTTVERYTQAATALLAEGHSFEQAMQQVVAAVLASPRFLYLYGPEKQVGQPLNELELATRLSFFLWGSIPDQRLLELATAGHLRSPDTLRAEVERLLRDSRLKRFCDSFPSQWLQLERIISAEPDPALYPQFYFAKYRASMHMMCEPLLLFETVLIEDLSILQLIDSDFSYRSELLEAWYRNGTQGTAGPPTQMVMRRVPITDRRQGGIITNAATLTMTSGTEQTKPMTRGAWLATVVLNDPPPPPPANVPPLEQTTVAADRPQNLRERFANHRHDPACAGCHARIDPLGFALENFDTIGTWRDNYDDGQPVDASGVLFAKYHFTDVVGFKDALLQEKDRFTRALAAHLLAYATGREIVWEDSPTLDRIVREVAAADYSMHELIQQVVLSDSFSR